MIYDATMPRSVTVYFDAIRSTLALFPFENCYQTPLFSYLTLSVKARLTT
jgi:hypothetical protein